MSDFDNLIRDELEHFQERFGLQPGADRNMLLLKAHLLIEEHLQLYIDSKVVTPAGLSEGRFTFHHRLVLVRALHSSPDRFGYSWVWESIRELNRLRNQLVHHVEPRDFMAHLSAFCGVVESHLARAVTPGNGDEYEMARLGLSLSILHLCLVRLTKSDQTKSGGA